MALVFRTVSVKNDALTPCACASCAASAPKTAANGVPAPPDMAQIIRDQMSGRKNVVPAPAADKTTAPASIDFVDAVKKSRSNQ